jgi:hypothetical protein
MQTSSGVISDCQSGLRRKPRILIVNLEMSSRPNACKNDIAEATRLTAAGLLGFYTHFEATEIFAVRNRDGKPLNIFSILVAEERTGDASTNPRYPGERIKLKELKGWIFGVIQTLKPISELLPALEALSNDAEWQISGEPLCFSRLMPAPNTVCPSGFHRPGWGIYSKTRQTMKTQRMIRLPTSARRQPRSRRNERPMLSSGGVGFSIFARRSGRRMLDVRISRRLEAYLHSAVKVKYKWYS